MKQIRLSILAVIAVLIGIRLLSPTIDNTAVPSSEIQNREIRFGLPEPASHKILSSSSYHIAYLLSRDAILEDDVLQPKNLFKDFTGHKISVVYTWQDLLKIHAAQPLNALVLHESAVSMVNFEWMADAYWHGITISTLSIRPTMIAHLYDNACLSFGYWMPVPDPEENVYYTVSTHTILSFQDQAANWYRRDWRRNCDWPRPAEMTDPFGWMLHYTSGPLNRDSHDMYRVMLLGHIDEAVYTREEFEKEHKR
jgi:hypothetical protein